MKKLKSLLKACLSSDMQLFNVNSKKKNGKKPSKALPIFIYILLIFCFFSYANIFIDSLEGSNLEFIVLSLFVFITFIFTLIEGIYKTGNLLFNCKDDDLLLSLPIKKSTVLFVRIFKFYLFEFLFNSVFMAPAMIAYALRCNVEPSYYLVSLIVLIMLPVIPVVISCFIGALMSGLSSRFKYKNLAQIIVTSIFFVGIMFVSFNLNNVIKDLAANATSINDIITKLYYPAGAYVNMILDFKITDFLIFIGINVGLFTLTILILSKVYFKINTRVKAVKSASKSGSNKAAVIKTNSPMKALIKKEFKKFTTSPVFITNAGIGLVLYLLMCVAVCIKFDLFASMFSSQGLEITEDTVRQYIPIFAFGLIAFGSFMTSITSSMISLEGRSINILKSLPVNPSTIIFAKVFTAVIIMIPAMIIGNILLFIFFNFSILQMLMVLTASIVFPLVSELVGIIMNLKYPKMDATTDAEVVKQSTSATVSVFIGMGLIGVVIFAIVYLRGLIGIDLSLLAVLSFFILLLGLLLIYMKKKSVKEFNSITV